MKTGTYKLCKLKHMKEKMGSDRTESPKPQGRFTSSNAEEVESFEHKMLRNFSKLITDTERKVRILQHQTE